MTFLSSPPALRGSVRPTAGGLFSEAVIGGVPHRVHTFTENGVYSVRGRGRFVDALLVGGGASGGSTTSRGGGGSPGAIEELVSLYLPVGDYQVTVGLGGLSVTGLTGLPGGDTIFNGVTALGGAPGGGGTTAADRVGRNGPSGGGGGGTGSGEDALGGTGISGKGTRGGKGRMNSTSSLRAGGGAGGAGGPGAAGIDGGKGGPGRQLNYDGTVRWFAAGGGGAVPSAGQGGDGGGGAGSATGAGSPGTTPGSGGGGGYGASGAGANGIVIIKSVKSGVLDDVSILDLISWSPNYPLDFAKVGSTWTVDFDRTDYIPDTVPVTTYYVNRTTGSSGNTGLSSGAAKSGIHQAITAGNATGQPYKIIVQAGTYERSFSITGSAGTVFPTQDVILEATGGRVITGHFETLTWPGTKDATYQNTTIAARSAVARVVNLLATDSFGDYTPLVKVADAATCNSTPGSYAQVGSNVHVNRGDGAVATNANTRVYLTSGSLVDLGVGMVGKKWYMKGIDLEGGGNASTVRVRQEATNVVAIFEDCSAKYSGMDGGGAQDAFAFEGAGLFVTDGCLVSSASKDAFNAHWLGDTQRKSFYLAIDCEGRQTGYTPASTSNNGFTLHETCVGIDVNGHYHHSRGGTIRNINDSRMLALGTRISDDAVGGGFDPVTLRTDDTAVIYAVDVTVEATAADLFSVQTVDPGSRIFTRNLTNTRGQVVGASPMPSNILV